MNKKQKEVELAKLADEEKELNHLKAIYGKASEDIQKKIRISDGKINFLLSEFDNLDDNQKSILQSQIYQKQFQESLKKQIDGFMKDLDSKQYKSVKDYMKSCYETGYIGTMYDLHGQGIPLVMPIDQKKVTRAMTHDTKLSTSLYKRLGVDVNLLKKRIANNISRGIATASEYRVIARNIALDHKVGINRAMRIARTEGHRVQVLSAVDAQRDAKDAGADVLKQWCSALDGRTRPHHRMLDGQIRELDEDFEVDGMKVKYPSGFGRASEDINCRCALLQRARWALDEDELNKLKERAEYYGLDKTKDFADFKKKYLKAVRKSENSGKMKVPKEHSEAYKTLIDGVKVNKVVYRDVEFLSTKLSDKEIINRLAGGDMTKGSCASLALAYIGNKIGLDVLDFRGGASLNFFSMRNNVRKFLNLPDVKGHVIKVKKEAADTAEIIQGLEYGKEYYLAIGRHAAIIRNTEKGAEYLELQSPVENGWMSFNRYGSTALTLQKRFGCRKTVDRMKIGSKNVVFEKEVLLMEVDSFEQNGEFQEILGYINTAGDKQKKGASGDVR